MGEKTRVKAIRRRRRRGESRTYFRPPTSGMKNNKAPKSEICKTELGKKEYPIAEMYFYV